MKKKIIIFFSLVFAGMVVLGVWFIQDLREPYADTYARYDLSEYLDIGDYKGLSATVEGVSDKEVEAEIKDRQKAKTKIVTTKEGKVKPGDSVTVEMSSKEGDKFIEKKKKISLIVGKGDYDAYGFEGELPGKEMGQSFSIKTKFSDAFSQKKYAGKTAEFDVKILSKKIEKVPSLAQLSNNKPNQYKEQIRKELEKEKQRCSTGAQEDVLWERVVESSKVKKYPEKEIERLIKKTGDEYRAYAKENGMTFGEFLKDWLQMDRLTFDKQAKEVAEATCKEELVVYYIVKKENLRLTKNELQKWKGLDTEKLKEVKKNLYLKMARKFVYENQHQ